MPGEDLHLSVVAPLQAHATPAFRPAPGPGQNPQTQAAHDRRLFVFADSDRACRAKRGGRSSRNGMSTYVLTPDCQCRPCYP
jgi:hypothetical protein